MKKTLFYILISVASAVSAQVSINTDGSQPDGSAMVDIKSTDRGLLIPRMTTAQRDAISSPAVGLEIYNLTVGCKQMYCNEEWNNIWCSCVPNITAEPTDSTIEEGSNVSFSVTSTGAGFTYQWQEDDGGWANINDGGVYSGTTTNTLLLTNVPLAYNNRAYRCVINGCSSADTSNTASLTVNPSPYPVGTVFCITGGSDIQGVSSNGEIWMDRNLGASQVALDKADPDAYGSLYQWGRFSDGHQCRTSSTTTTNATTAVPNDGNAWDGKFITESSSPFDWLTPQDGTLWQGVSGTNNPCPSGYRLPTESEWTTEKGSWSPSSSFGAFLSPLQLTVAGFRSESGSFYSAGSAGLYWSSTVSGTNAVYLELTSGGTSLYNYYRALGCSVRCIQD